jgi:hypothetical protein
MRSEEEREKGRGKREKGTICSTPHKMKSMKIKVRKRVIEGRRGGVSSSQSLIFRRR